MSELNALLAVARKDLLQELRSRATTVATVFFSGMTLMLMAFALGRDPSVLAQSAPGVLWVAVVLAGVIAAAQNFQADLDEGAFEQLLTYPVARSAIYLGKLLANWLYLAALALLLAPLAMVLYGASVDGGAAILTLIGTLLLGAFGFAVIATFYAALTSNLQAREALLPVLMFPIVVPILLAAVRASEALLGGDVLGGLVSAFGGGLAEGTPRGLEAGSTAGDVGLASDWLLLLAGFDLVYFVVCSALFHFVVDE